MWIHPEHGELIALAAIYEPSIDEHGEVLDTFAIVTTEPTEQLAPIHDRMPLLLDAEGIERWLEPGSLEDGVLKHIVRGVRALELAVRPVSTAVSSPQNDQPRCIEAVADGEDGEDGDDEGEQLELF
jgi:putative SOS response-associated peptidase YedK